MIVILLISALFFLISLGVDDGNHWMEFPVPVSEWRVGLNRVTTTSTVANRGNMTSQSLDLLGSTSEMAPGSDPEKWIEARSPGVNAGTHDGYDYDTTSTRMGALGHQIPKVELGEPDLGYHHYLRIGDDDELDSSQEFDVTFLPPKEEVFTTDYYRVSVADTDRFETFEHDSTVLRPAKKIRFLNPLPAGKYVMNVAAFPETGPSSENSNDLNFLVEPDPLTEQDRTITATGLDAQGTPVPDAVKKVYWDESTKTVYYNPNNNTVKNVRVTVGVPESKTPWKVDFGARGTNPSEGHRWGHFEDYEVFKQTPTP